MTSATSGGPRRYDRQRPRKTPPHVTLVGVRTALGLTLDAVSQRITDEAPGLHPTRGALSAIESGTRGASPAMLAALETAYGLPAGSITTDYTPVGRKAVA